MDLQLAGKRALVTGSTAGIGRAVAIGLAREGAAVVVNGRSPEKVAAAIADLDVSDRLTGVAADLSTANGTDRLVQEALAGGPVDILVNNAGIFEPQPFEEISDDDWERVFRINVLSGVRLSRALLGGMRQRGWGRILFISSESGVNIPTEMIHYGVTKTAQIALSRGLARTLAGTGVTVNSVLPGPTWTDGVATFVEQIAAAENKPVEEMKREFVAQQRPTSLIGRFAEAEEVAAMVVFLCSAQASLTTGAAIRVEGGIINSCF